MVARRRKTVICACYPKMKERLGSKPMVSKRAKPGSAPHNLVAAALARFRPAAQSRGGRPAQQVPLSEGSAALEPLGPDPVSLAVFAIDRVGPAAVRACASGVEVRIAAADEATAAVIRAALTETARRRPTDRLIRVETD
jgi:hypothetical protein